MPAGKCAVKINPTKKTLLIRTAILLPDVIPVPVVSFINIYLQKKPTVKMVGLNHSNKYPLTILKGLFRAIYQTAGSLPKFFLFDISQSILLNTLITIK